MLSSEGGVKVGEKKGMMTRDDVSVKLREVLKAHHDWVLGREGGVRLDLCGAYLCGADLRGAYLCGADLSGADLRGTIFAIVE